MDYYNGHHSDEILVFDEWYHMPEISAKLLMKEQPKFLMNT